MRLGTSALHVYHSRCLQCDWLAVAVPESKFCPSLLLQPRRFCSACRLPGFLCQRAMRAVLLALPRRP